MVWQVKVISTLQAFLLPVVPHTFSVEGSGLTLKRSFDYKSSLTKLLYIITLSQIGNLKSRIELYKLKKKIQVVRLGFKLGQVFVKSHYFYLVCLFQKCIAVHQLYTVII